jgi:hypothetical protein
MFKNPSFSTNVTLFMKGTYLIKEIKLSDEFVE